MAIEGFGNRPKELGCFEDFDADGITFRIQFDFDNLAGSKPECSSQVPVNLLQIRLS